MVSLATFGSTVGIAPSRRWAFQVATHGADILLHGARIADDAPGPFQHALALRRKTLEARSAAHQHDAESGFQLLYRGGQGLLRDAILFRRVAKMLACEG